MKKNNGGPAFPQPINPLEYGRGMALRDYFAAKAMQAHLTDPDSGSFRASEIAQAAYQMADAMLAAREK